MTPEEIIASIPNKGRGKRNVLDNFTARYLERTIRELGPTVLDVAEFSVLQRPCAYVMLENDTPVYVGVAANGVHRALDKNHHARKSYGAQPEKVTLLWCNDYDEAKKLEKLLISKLRPTLNRRGRMLARSAS